MHRGLSVILGLVLAPGVAASLVVSSAGAASADDTVLVRGLGFPADGLTNLSIVGCSGIFDRVPEPIATFLSRSDDAPAGSRSLKYDLAGGNAVGSQHRVTSMAATTVAGLSLAAPEGASGVAYAGYQAPADAGTDLVWVGRAALSAAPGGWRPVDVAGLSYTWTQYHLATQQPVPATTTPTDPAADPASDTSTGGAADVPAFLAAHGGDGPGFFTVGFGCDGAPFKIDALRIGSPGAVTTYDLEGFTSVTGMTSVPSRVVAGAGTTITASLTDGAGAPLDSGLLVLEGQAWGAHGFTPVEGGAVRATGGHAGVTVDPSTRTVYRWRYLGSSSVDGSTSGPVVVDVAPVLTAQPSTGAAKEGATAVVVTGQLTPATAGVRATLWRLTDKRPVAVGSALTRADGSYEIPLRDAPAGTGRYQVTVPAAGGVLAGQSPALAIAGAGAPR